MNRSSDAKCPRHGKRTGDHFEECIEAQLNDRIYSCMCGQIEERTCTCSQQPDAGIEAEVIGAFRGHSPECDYARAFVNECICSREEDQLN